MKKLVYIICGAGLLVAFGCNEPAEFDHTVSERRADSIANARLEAESQGIYAEYDEICGRQLSVLELTRDSLQNIYASTPSGKKSGAKTTSGTKTNTGTNTNSGGTTEPAGKGGKMGGQDQNNTDSKGGKMGGQDQNNTKDKKGKIGG